MKNLNNSFFSLDLLKITIPNALCSIFSIYANGFLFERGVAKIPRNAKPRERIFFRFVWGMVLFGITTIFCLIIDNKSGCKFFNLYKNIDLHPISCISLNSMVLCGIMSLVALPIKNYMASKNKQIEIKESLFHNRETEK